MNEKFANPHFIHFYKERARYQLQAAVKRGELVRPGVCEHCSQTQRTEGHHADYSKHLEVIWLCKKCHWVEHVRIKKEGVELIPKDLIIEDWELETLSLKPPKPQRKFKHGTTRGYNHYKCRCDRCSRAVRVYRRKRLAQQE